jgi:hypothetical protein
VAGAHERPPTSKRDLTLVLSAVGAIFAGLIGTNVLDTGNSAPWMGKIDHAAVVLWLPALLLLALCAYKSPTENRWLREGAWAATALAGLVTAVVLLFTGFGFTRDTDHVRLLLSKTGMKSLRTLCGVHADHIDGTIRTKTLAGGVRDLRLRGGLEARIEARRGVREQRRHPPRRRRRDPGGP